MLGWVALVCTFGYLDAPGPLVGASLAGLAGWTVFTAVKFMKAGQEQRKWRRTVDEWEGRGLREEFRRFEGRDGLEGDEVDARVQAARSISARIDALQSSDRPTHDRVALLLDRVERLAAEQRAARSAIETLQAAGGDVGAERLEAASQAMDAELQGILSGLSGLYATLLEADTAVAGRSDEASEALEWLRAEAEVAAAREAARPATRRATASETPLPPPDRAPEKVRT
jgi:hypothetical protein